MSLNLNNRAKISAVAALEKLRAGNRRFVGGERNPAAVITPPGAVLPQSPTAAVLACSDARAPVELIFGCGIGDLFVVRVAGNIATPTQIGSLEFAVSQLAVPLIVVLGHSHCGAVSAALAALQSQPSADAAPENLSHIIRHIQPAIRPLLSTTDNSDTTDATATENLLTAAIRANACAAAAHLTQHSPTIAQAVAAGTLTVTVAHYDIAGGSVTFG